MPLLWEAGLKGSRINNPFPYLLKRLYGFFKVMVNDKDAQNLSLMTPDDIFLKMSPGGLMENS